MSVIRFILPLFLLGFAASVHAAAEADAAAEDKNAETAAISYFALEPPFVVNVDEGEEIHHLQLAISFIPTSPDTAELLSKHEAAIRHAIVVLVSGRQVADINSIQGKKKLREEIQLAVNKVMEENTGKPAIKRTLFTGFLIQ